ncbi:DUF2171 domain-containing protein [Singulisphaera acidiphila]|uniref:DUF2171 domain-containing protein n=1 Tax=Singulisphaera acidiphila (strain ATCC BAA-1392 / DSM 18658 / VKM B-2454 / MOB10) TaxID=886293 RepID=L0D7J3_SINAD|nr:DUF2171 domain-containing protein [Singulisphaera acidiphila]AGA24830.1 hypothetical protein Sinac_0391 [Singulisphaera acidiphila DSM 18658]
MAESFKDKLEDAGHKIAEKASEAGHKVSEKVEEAADWAKEKAHQVGHRIEETVQKVGHRTAAPLDQSHGATGSTSDIREHMEVYGSCGNLLGKVDHVEGDHIKLTKNDSPDGQHHKIPLSWVAKVHDHVHLSKSCGEAQREWTS